MNRVIAWLQNFLLRQVLIVCLIGATFFVGQCFISGSAIIAQADVRTPEGTYYKGTPNNEGIRNDTQVRNAQEKLRETADNVREKLNLDEATPKATKDFQKSVQRKAGEAVEPITGTQRGYYQQPETVREMRR
ncbi:hypothetical protein [Nostoc sp. PCC 7524]|uniref:hypothetical protein n=1 Tax=Nostoc sp. (strain ATCC 29411 / PCC 7524) TaxID=28072 RepID=UPI0005A2336B|nr:hypothetical protein [Nostoc sp. PCC 7524]